jgi:hypothetical protein
VAFTQADLDALDASMQSGAPISIQFRDRKVTYDTIEEKLKLRQVMKDEIALATGTSNRTSRVAYGRE